MNDTFVAQGSQFIISDVEVTVATVDLDDITSFRGAIGSRGPQAATSPSYPCCHLPINVCHRSIESISSISHPIQLQYFMPEEEIMLGKWMMNVR